MDRPCKAPTHRRFLLQGKLAVGAHFPFPCRKKESEDTKYTGMGRDPQRKLRDVCLGRGPGGLRCTDVRPSSQPEKEREDTYFGLLLSLSDAGHIAVTSHSHLRSSPSTYLPERSVAERQRTVNLTCVAVEPSPAANLLVCVASWGAKTTHTHAARDVIIFGGEVRHTRSDGTNYFLVFPFPGSAAPARKGHAYVP